MGTLVLSVFVGTCQEAVLGKGSGDRRGPVWPRGPVVTRIVVYWGERRGGPVASVTNQESHRLQIMQRYVLAAVTLALLGGAVWLYFQDTSSNASAQFYGALCMRAGLVCGALWLAFPKVVPLLSRRPSPFKLAIVLGILMVVISPRLALPVGGVVAVIGVLQAVKWLFAPLETKREQPSKTKEK